MTHDRLAFILRAPELVARVVRAALAESLARPDRADAFDVRTFTNRALRALESELDATRDVPATLDAVERHELAAATVRAATRFATSRVARRLAQIPKRRLRGGTTTGDVVVLDATGRTHVVRLEAASDDAARVTAMRTIGAALRSPSTALRPPAVHFFSLRDGKLRSFDLRNAAVRRERPASRAA